MESRLVLEILPFDEKEQIGVLIVVIGDISYNI